MKVTNHYNVPLITAVWLLNDNYDFDNRPKTISTTTLLKPLKKFILSRRVNKAESSIDVADLMATALGSAIHDSIEAVWKDDAKRNAALEKLGVPAQVRDLILINPKMEDIKEDSIPVFFEQRAERQFQGWTITGKYDQIADGRVQDVKSTGVFSFMTGKKDEDYINQLSILKWLNPDKVTDTTGQINFVFTDWQSFRAKQDPNYPEKRFDSVEYPLKNDQLVENFISNKLKLIEQYMDTPEEEIPECTQEDLWQDAPVFKYYSDPSKASSGGRATKNFSDKDDAHRFLMEKGKGIVIPVEGKPRACGYCDAFEVCKQKDRYELL